MTQSRTTTPALPFSFSLYEVVISFMYVRIMAVSSSGVQKSSPYLMANPPRDSL